METIFMDTENSKTNEPHKFVYNVSQRLDLRSLDSNVAAQSLSIYYTWKNVRTINLEKKAPTWNDEFELPDGSYCFTYSRLY